MGWNFKTWPCIASIENQLMKIHSQDSIAESELPKPEAQSVINEVTAQDNYVTQSHKSYAENSVLFFL